MKKISLIALILTLIALTASLFSCAGGCEHEWDEGVVTKEPTCTTNGIMTYACTKCDETKKVATASKMR